MESAQSKHGQARFPPKEEPRTNCLKEFWPGVGQVLNESSLLLQGSWIRSIFTMCAIQTFPFSNSEPRARSRCNTSWAQQSGLAVPQQMNQGVKGSPCPNNSGDMAEGSGNGQKIPISQQAPDTEWACGQQAGTRSFYGVLELDQRGLPVLFCPRSSGSVPRCSLSVMQYLNTASHRTLFDLVKARMFLFSSQLQSFSLPVFPSWLLVFWKLTRMCPRCP